MNCSIAAAMAAACSGDAEPRASSIWGRVGRRLPLRLIAADSVPAVPELPVFDQEAVLRAISPGEAIERVREGFVEYAGGDWQMPPKVYLESHPHGDFRAMPAKGAGIAILKWVTSFPRNPEAGLPVVMGMICVSSADNGEPLALVDVRAVTALRTGAVAAVAAQELGREDAETVGIVGCGLHGAWAARCLAAAEYGPGVCFDPDPEAAGRLAGELGWEAGSRDEALACDVVTCVTPGYEPAVFEEDLRPGLHLNMLGADGPGKAEATPQTVAGCELFCDDWIQASHGGELTGAVEAGLVSRDRVRELGDVLTGAAAGRSDSRATTLFDSTGLAIQDLAICLALLSSHRAGRLSAATVRL
jgi:alanine dehydrogenase